MHLGLPAQSVYVVQPEDSNRSTGVHGRLSVVVVSGVRVHRALRDRVETRVPLLCETVRHFACFVRFLFPFAGPGSYEKNKGLLTLIKSESKSEKDQRINGKHQRKLSL